MRRMALTLALLAAGLAAGGCGGTTSSSPATRPQTQTAPPVTGSTAATTTGTTPSRAELTLRAYFVRDGRVVPVGRTVTQTPAVARAALEQLLAGPTAAEQADGIATDIPGGVALEGVTIAGGHASVRLGPQLASTDPTARAAALAQIVFTVTQFPSVHDVLVSSGNEQLTPQAATRGDYEQQTPLILVESPLPGETVTSPLHVRGSANVFEATFQLEVQDGSGAVLWKHFVTASSGAPQRGTFDVAIPLRAPAGPLRVVAYDENQANGQREHEVVVPVQLAR